MPTKPTTTDPTEELQQRIARITRRQQSGDVWASDAQQLADYQLELEHHLDRDTRAETAFNTWRAFVAAVRDGYLPTVFGRTPAQLRLRAALVAAGLPVWPAEVKP